MYLELEFDLCGLVKRSYIYIRSQVVWVLGPGFFIPGNSGLRGVVVFRDGVTDGSIPYPAPTSLCSRGVIVLAVYLQLEFDSCGFMFVFRGGV